MADCPAAKRAAVKSPCGQMRRGQQNRLPIALDGRALSVLNSLNAVSLSPNIMADIFMLCANILLTIKLHRLELESKKYENTHLL